MKVYLLSELDDRLSCYWHESIDFNVINCPVDPGHMHSAGRIGDLKVRCREDRLKRAGGAIWSQYSELIIHKNIIETLRAFGITGFTTRKATVCSPKGGGILSSDYEEFVVSGWGGSGTAASGIVLLRSCEACGYSRYSVYTNACALFDKDQWDKSNIFRIWPLAGSIFCDEKAMAVIKGTSVFNVQFTDINELRPIGATICPGPLDQYADSGIVRQYGRFPSPK